MSKTFCPQLPCLKVNLHVINNHQGNKFQQFYFSNFNVSITDNICTAASAQRMTSIAAAAAAIAVAAAFISLLHTASTKNTGCC